MNLTNGNVMTLLCRCGCGGVTATIKRQPGAEFRVDMFGFITGHEKRRKFIITPQEIADQRRAEVLINAAKIVWRDGMNFATEFKRGAKGNQLVEELKERVRG